METNFPEFNYSAVKQRLRNCLAKDLPRFSAIFYSDYSSFSNGQDGCSEFNSKSGPLRYNMIYDRSFAFQKNEGSQINGEKTSTNTHIQILHLLVV